MIEILVKKVTGNMMIPINDEEAEKMAAFKLGSVLRVKIVVVRNPAFHAKWWSLAEMAFGYWQETGVMPKYNGEDIEPNFKRFRKDLIILSGFYHIVVSVRGGGNTITTEADSIAWGNMNEDTFEKLYNATINAVLKHVYNSKISEAELRRRVDEVMSYA